MYILIRPTNQEPSNEEMQAIIQLVSQQVGEFDLEDILKSDMGLIFRDQSGKKVAELGFMR